MVTDQEEQVTGVRGERFHGEYRFVGATLYDIHLEREEVAAGTGPKPTLTAALGGFAIDDDGHDFSAVMRLTLESLLPGDDTQLVRLKVGVAGHWISAEPLTTPIDGQETIDRLFPYAKAYAEQVLGQAQIDLPPIPDMADVPFADAVTPEQGAAIGDHADETVAAAQETG